MFVEPCASCKFYNPDSEVFVSRTDDESCLLAPSIPSDMGHHISYDDTLGAGNVSDDAIRLAFSECIGRDGTIPFGRTPCHALIELSNVDNEATREKNVFVQSFIRAWRGFRRLSRLMED